MNEGSFWRTCAWIVFLATLTGFVPVAGQEGSELGVIGEATQLLSDAQELESQTIKLERKLQGGLDTAAGAALAIHGQDPGKGQKMAKEAERISEACQSTAQNILSLSRELMSRRVGVAERAGRLEPGYSVRATKKLDEIRPVASRTQERAKNIQEGARNLAKRIREIISDPDEQRRREAARRAEELRRLEAAELRRLEAARRAAQGAQRQQTSAPPPAVVPLATPAPQSDRLEAPRDNLLDRYPMP